jgi:hypothetical protein
VRLGRLTWQVSGGFMQFISAHDDDVCLISVEPALIKHTSSAVIHGYHRMRLS